MAAGAAARGATAAVLREAEGRPAGHSVRSRPSRYRAAPRSTPKKIISFLHILSLIYRRALIIWLCCCTPVVNSAYPGLGS